MLNRNQMKAARKLMEQLDQNDAAPLFALKGVIEDLKAKKFPDEAALSHFCTVGDVTAIPNWDTDPAPIDMMAAAVLGRMTQFVLADGGINAALGSIEQIIELTTMTNDQQARLVVAICGREKYDVWIASQIQPGSVTF